MEAQTDEIMCCDLGFPKGQLRVTEGVGGQGLPARALQALDSHRGSIKPEVPEVLSWHATDDILLPRCRNTEGPPSWNPSDPNVTRPPHSFRGVGGGLHSFTGGCVVSCGEQFSPAGTPLQRAKGSMQQALLYNEQWSLQCGVHSVKNLRDSRKRFH